MKKLIVFDWNGTLLSDTQACFEADNTVIKYFGGQPINLQTYKDTIIIPAIDFYSQHGCDRKEMEENIQRVGEVFHSFYEPRAAKCRTRRGVQKLLTWLKYHSVISIILSNHTITGINNQLVRLGINDYISEVLANASSNYSFIGRNKKEKLEIFVNKRGYKPKDILIIGDSPEETEIGKTLGIETVAITGGYYSEARLKTAKPDHLISNMSELQEIILRQN